MTFPIYFPVFQRTSQRHSSLCGGLLVLWRFFHFSFLLSTRKLPPSSRFIFLKSAISSRRYILLWMPRRHLVPLIHLLFPWKGKESLEDLLEFRAIQARSTLLDLYFSNVLKYNFLKSFCRKIVIAPLTQRDGSQTFVRSPFLLRFQSRLQPAGPYLRFYTKVFSQFLLGW